MFGQMMLNNNEIQSISYGGTPVQGNLGIVMPPHNQQINGNMLNGNLYSHQSTSNTPMNNMNTNHNPYNTIQSNYNNHSGWSPQSCPSKSPRSDNAVGSTKSQGGNM